MVRITAIILLTALVIAATALVQGDVGDPACVSFTYAATTACGITVDSDYGNGAVELCDDCFPCGEADEVCPEDFGADCTQCCDPDCLVNITGTVFTPEGGSLANADVIADFRHIPTPYYTRTDDIGFYRMEVPRCNYTLRFRADDYPYQDVYFPLEQAPADPFLLDVSMTTPQCTNQCTSWTETGMKCQTICRGDNGCAPATPPYAVGGTIMTDLLQACEDVSATPGTTVYLGTVVPGTQLWGTCCSGPVYTTNWRQSIKPITNATDITQKIIPVTYKGDSINIRGVKFKIITYTRK